MNSEYDDITIYDYWLIVKERYRLLLAVFLIIFIPSSIFILTRPVKFEAKAIFICKDMNSVSEQAKISLSYNIIRSIEAKEVAGIVIKAEPTKNTRILTLMYENTDKDLALRVVKHWTRKYLLFNNIISSQEQKDSKVILLTKPYVKKAEDKRVKNILASFFISTILGLSAVMANYTWEEAKRNRRDK